MLEVLILSASEILLINSKLSLFEDIQEAINPFNVEAICPKYKDTKILKKKTS